MQVTLSTDGRASFASFIFNDGEGMKALRIPYNPSQFLFSTVSNTHNLIPFSTVDQTRSFLPLPDTSNLVTLRGTLDSFRIDGKK